MTNDFKKAQIDKAIESIKKIGGYEIYVTPDENNGFYYAFIVTPSNNLMSIQNNCFWGLDFILEYVPSRSTGSGCHCSIDGSNDGYTGEITKEVLIALENDGLRFARRLHAKLYSDGRKAIKDRWNYDKLIKVV